MICHIFVGSYYVDHIGENRVKLFLPFRPVALPGHMVGRIHALARHHPPNTKGSLVILKSTVFGKHSEAQLPPRFLISHPVLLKHFGCHLELGQINQPHTATVPVGRKHEINFIARVFNLCSTL